MPYDRTSDNYIETIIVNDKMINVFDNDYGQCYWFQWLEDGELKEMTCGTYNLNYRQEIEDYFKPSTEVLREAISNLNQTVRELQREVEELKQKN